MSPNHIILTFTPPIPRHPTRPALQYTCSIIAQHVHIITHRFLTKICKLNLVNTTTPAKNPLHPITTPPHPLLPFASIHHMAPMPTPRVHRTSLRYASRLHRVTHHFFNFFSRTCRFVQIHTYGATAHNAQLILFGKSQVLYIFPQNQYDF
jgi:hypothetical protein